ncbi:general secretion pathway protein GspK [Methylocapsa sp. S129]|uniref:general secretion pathway protein GspK n=1 Tax=Methylocapsa sp. S129 TaxID=1641869 RepID=UPI00131D42C8|nr:type II secretion system protein GspK [Methylocapsa sp. S129]
MSHPRGKNETSESGFILVAVLWMIMALATLALIYSVYVSRTVATSHVTDDRLQAEASIRAGVELAAYQLLNAPESARPTNGLFTAHVGKVNIAVQYRSEGARIDLNAAPKALLVGLFEAIGVGEGAATSYADRVTGWRQRPQPEGADGDEAAFYKTAGASYPPRQAPFANALELSLVLNIPPYVVERVLPLVTVYNGRAEIDALNAAPETLAALPGMTPEILNGALAQRVRRPDDGPALLQALGDAAKYTTIQGRSAFRALMSVDLDHKRSIHAEVVFLLLDNGDEPFRMLYWRDDFDGPL